jgi:hypothetical protein
MGRYTVEPSPDLRPVPPGIPTWKARVADARVQLELIAAGERDRVNEAAPGLLDALDKVLGGPDPEEVTIDPEEARMILCFLPVNPRPGSIGERIRRKLLALTNG